MPKYMKVKVSTPRGVVHTVYPRGELTQQPEAWGGIQEQPAFLSALCMVEAGTGWLEQIMSVMGTMLHTAPLT